MATYIPINGLKLQVVASNTFPAGFEVSQFADDADPLDFPTVKIGDSAIGPNGDLVAWNMAAKIPLNLNVVPTGTDDDNLSALFNANFPGRGKVAANDKITIVGVYQSGKTVTLSQGVCIQFMPADSGVSTGRLKTKPYSFEFESIAVTN